MLTKAIHSYNLHFLKNAALEHSAFLTRVISQSCYFKPPQRAAIDTTEIVLKNWETVQLVTQIPTLLSNTDSEKSSKV